MRGEQRAQPALDHTAGATGTVAVHDVNVPAAALYMLVVGSHKIPQSFICGLMMQV